MRRAHCLAVLIAIVLTGCAGLSSEAGAPREQDVTFDGLHLVRGTLGGRLWIRPGASLEGKTSILPSYLGLSYRRPPTNRHGNYALDERQMERLREILHDVFLEELTRDDGWLIAEAPGPEVVSIRARLMDVVVKVPSERAVGRDRSYTASAGEATLVLEIHDSQTRQILARFADRRRAERPGGQMLRSVSIGNGIELRRMFRHWAGRLRRGLDDVRARGTFVP